MGLSASCTAAALPSSIKQATLPDSNFLDQLEKSGNQTKSNEHGGGRTLRLKDIRTTADKTGLTGSSTAE